MCLDAFTEHFASIEELRQSAKVSYPLFDIMFITLYGVIAGAEGWKEIQEYAEGHHNWFKKQGVLTEGVPVDDTIVRIIARINPIKLPKHPNLSNYSISKVRLSLLMQWVAKPK